MRNCFDPQQLTRSMSRSPSFGFGTRLDEARTNFFSLFQVTKLLPTKVEHQSFGETAQC